MSFDFVTYPHRRFNPLLGQWVLVSPHRTKRPWLGQVEQIAPDQRVTYDSNCYLCPGNPRAGIATNPHYDSTFVFTNDFPALLPNTPECEVSHKTLLQTESVRGECRVICYSPRHDLTLAEMSAFDIRKVVEVWTVQSKELSKHYSSVQIFENKGSVMGCSNPHPHGQIWAGNFLPNEIANENLQQLRYLQNHRSPLLLDYARKEIREGERVVEHTKYWLAVVPFWAVWPFEFLLLPLRHLMRFSELTLPERVDLAEILRAILVRYDNLFQVSFPYSMGWHSAPNVEEDSTHWQLHAHFYPPLLRSATVKKFMVGYEMLAEAQRDLTAEQAAQRLREVSTSHFQENLKCQS